ncbi:mitochondrial import inner membrane translocase subunit TIM50 [Selaginella moellendorffii]|nr:mitochondrial import inner membrane translocase subunit TIM50 [Selaginella moellendorffii]|eukprot:XP_024530840.1 mitochondrial import inner membrane translocase subunit TIM50 [Selaginella moellendorffii]
MAEEGKPVLVLDLNETLVWKKDASTIVNRPGLEAFLSRMAMAYSLVIFSVSDSRHLDQSVAGFGASAKLITDVYGIEDCTRTRTGFIKDVRKVKVRHELKRLVWVDNERFHFRLCPHNGIEIKPFRGEADDAELERLTPLLLMLSQVDDVTQFLWNGQPKEEAQEQYTGKNPGKPKAKKKK